MPVDLSDMGEFISAVRNRFVFATCISRCQMKFHQGSFGCIGTFRIISLGIIDHEQTRIRCLTDVEYIVLQPRRVRIEMTGGTLAEDFEDGGLSGLFSSGLSEGIHSSQMLEVVLCLIRFWCREGTPPGKAIQRGTHVIWIVLNDHETTYCMFQKLRGHYCKMFNSLQRHPFSPFSLNCYIWTNFLSWGNWGRATDSDSDLTSIAYTLQDLFHSGIKHGIDRDGFCNTKKVRFLLRNMIETKATGYWEASVILCARIWWQSNRGWRSDSCSLDTRRRRMTISWLLKTSGNLELAPKFSIVLSFLLL